MLPEKRACAGRVERGSHANAAWLTALGHRPMQQDVALMSAPLYGIFDGHGPDGLLTAQRAAELLRQHFARPASDSAPPPECIEAAFEATQAALLSVRVAF